MDSAAEFKLIRQLIADNQNREAAERLSRWFEGKSADRQDAAFALLNRIAALNDNVLRGLTSQADATLENNRITQALLDLAKQLDETTPIRTVSNRLSTKWLIAAAAVILAVALFWVFNKSGNVSAPSTFDLTVNLHGPGGESDLIRQGKIKLVLGDYHLPLKDINSDGQAIFDKIAGEYFDKTVHLIPIGMRYQVVAQSAQTPAESRSITFSLKPLPDTTLARGIVFLSGSGNKPAAGARLDFNLGQAQGITSENGHFQVPVPVAAGATVKLMIDYQGKNRYNRDITLSADVPLQITLNQ